MKLILVIDNLNCGGIATSLYNFVNENHNSVDIDILVFDNSSVDYTKIPPNVNILGSDKRLLVIGASFKNLLRSNKRFAIKKLYLSLLGKLKSGFEARKILFSKISPINGHYDVAIAYSHDNGWHSLSTGCIQFVLDKIDAQYKMGYLHCDYAHFGGFDNRQINVFNKLDKILLVSYGARDSFQKCFPSLSEKTFVLENFINVEKVRELGSNCFAFDHACVNFVTVCRLSKEKGILRCLNAFSYVKKQTNRPFKWLIIGNGPEYKRILKSIKKLGLSSNVLLLGQKSNPFPFLNGTDFFLLPSFHEAAPMVFGECRVFETPIISTETSSSRELVDNRGIGFTCENSLKGLSDYLLKALNGTLPSINPINSDINLCSREQIIDLFSSYGFKK